MRYPCRKLGRCVPLRLNNSCSQHGGAGVADTVLAPARFIYKKLVDVSCQRLPQKERSRALGGLLCCRKGETSSREEVPLGAERVRINPWTVVTKERRASLGCWSSEFWLRGDEEAREAMVVPWLST